MTELSRDRELEITLSAIMTRGRYAPDPQPTIDELRSTAGHRTSVLAFAVGLWIGFYETKDTRPLTDALRAEFSDLDLVPGITLGTERRQRPTHGTHDFHRLTTKRPRAHP